MRLLLVLSICFCVANSIALGQRADSSRSLAPAPQRQTTPQLTPQTARPQTARPQTAPPQTTPPADDLSLDSNQSYNFNDLDSSQYASASDPQSSIASNSDFRGASPQMIGDFGGGSTILSVDKFFGPDFPGAPLSVQVPFAGGSRRDKFAENNQVQPLNRVYSTFNYFDNAIVSGGTGSPVVSENLLQYSMGIEKRFYEDFSIGVRMPLVGNIDYEAISNSPGPGLSGNTARVSTNGVGNLSTSIKALLLQMGQTSISTGLAFSIPTGSETEIRVSQDGSNGSTPMGIRFDNDALHLMPFIGIYRQFEKSWWLQACTQIDVPTSGNDVRVDGVFIGRLNEQTLLYSDISLGKWLYRKPSNSYRRRQRGITGVASILELHYTSSLNDADTLLNSGSPGPENRFDVLNSTMGLQVEFSERWRINAAGVVPLRKRELEITGDRREDRFFDGEFSLQINRFF